MPATAAVADRARIWPRASWPGRQPAGVFRRRAQGGRGVAGLTASSPVLRDEVLRGNHVPAASALAR